MWGPRSRDGGIDRIPLPSPSGALWLCGKHHVGPDPEAALARVSATTIVCLNEAHELEARYPAYVAWLREQRHVRAVWFPIPDLHAPPAHEVGPLLSGLRERLDRGEHLIVHCGAGIGRAGTVATAVLLGYGVPLADALAIVAEHRPMAGPEVGAQLALVEELARRA
jgi:protein-tyrosine phosphatase